MSTIMEFLESLSNKEVLAKCIEYGLPNIPVTDTSRKVIIKRLHETMTGEPTMLTKKKTEKKRQTMHDTRSQSHITEEVDTFPTAQSSKLRNRHTLAATPIGFASPQEKNNARRNEVAAASSYDDLNNSYTYSHNNYSRNNSITGSVDNHSDSHSRRSVSLTKSGVLTTSYSTEVLPSKEHDEYDDDDEVESAEDDEEDPYSYEQPKTITSSHNKTNEFPFDNHYGSAQFPKTSTKNPYDNDMRYPYTRTEYPMETSKNYAYDEPARYSYAATDAQKTLPKLRQTNLTNFNIGGEHYNNNDIYNVGATTQSNNNTLPSKPLYPFDMLNSTAHAAAAEDLAAKPYLRQSPPAATARPRQPYEDALKRTLYFSPSAAPSKVHKRVTYAAPEDEDDAMDEEPMATEHYASNFARNLKSTSSPVQANDYKPLARRSLVKQQSDDVSVMKPLHDFFIALDNKYHIMRYVAITAFLLIVLFIIVLFLP